MAHILAVDDDPDLCTLLKTALERDGHAERLGQVIVRPNAKAGQNRLFIGAGSQK